MANPSMFPLPNRVKYLPVFIYSPENFLLVTLSSQLIFSILLHIHISKASMAFFFCYITAPGRSSRRLQTSRRSTPRLQTSTRAADPAKLFPLPLSHSGKNSVLKIPELGSGSESRPKLNGLLLASHPIPQKKL